MTNSSRRVAKTMPRKEKVSAEKVAQCEAKAQSIVETLLDPVTDRAEFLSQLRWINPDHYQSITEERAIQKTCGYPLCEEKLTNIPTKKYKICTSQNKVYDLTNRKNFCSNQCYKASNYLKQQISASPLWVREQEEVPKFILLENSTELMGEEISFGIERVSFSQTEVVSDPKGTDESKLVKSKPERSISVADVSTNCSIIENNVDPLILRAASNDLLCRDAETTSLANSTGSKLHSINHRDSVSDAGVKQLTSFNSKVSAGNHPDHSLDKIHRPNQPTSVNFMHNVRHQAGSAAEDSAPNHPKSNVPQISNNHNNCLKNHELKTAFPDSSVKNKSTTGASNFVLRVEKSLREWCTLETLTFILGVESVKQMMLGKGKIFETRKQDESDSHMYERYATILKKLKILKMETEKYENEVKFEKPTQPLPDFATLEKQTEEMTIKVRAFYRGDKKVTFDENKNENDENGTSVVLPPLHLHTKMAIRRNVVLDKLKKILPDLAMMLGLRTTDLNEEIKQLALTCKFAAHNVTFKPVEWNLIGLIFIKLISLRDTDFQKHLREKANYVNAMLMSYQLESNYLDLLCTWLMDLDEILRNDEEPS